MTEYAESMERFLQWHVGKCPMGALVNNFPKYVQRFELSRFLARNELFKKIINVEGSIIECGVLHGTGLMTWAHLSAIYEPYAWYRVVYGFDTFTGFPSVSEHDPADAKVGDLRSAEDEEIGVCIKLMMLDHPTPSQERIRVIKGDFMETGKKFLQDNPHVLVALLFMDFDLYEPTKNALELFLPRMPKGAILAFDELNNPDWKGETIAVLQSMGVRGYSVKRFSFEPQISYIEL